MIDVTIRCYRQDLLGEAINHDTTPKTRAVICRNSYDFQSYARTEAWTTERGWQTISEVDPSTLTVWPFTYVSEGRKPWRGEMRDDLIDLLNRAAVFVS